MSWGFGRGAGNQSIGGRGADDSEGGREGLSGDEPHKVQTTSTRELDDADVQVEQLNQRIAASEAELERLKQEVGEARKEVNLLLWLRRRPPRSIQNTERTPEERIEQLEHDLRMARSQSRGCQCTIS